MTPPLARHADGDVAAQGGLRTLALVEGGGSRPSAPASPLSAVVLVAGDVASLSTAVMGLAASAVSAGSRGRDDEEGCALQLLVVCSAGRLHPVHSGLQHAAREAAAASREDAAAQKSACGKQRLSECVAIRTAVVYSGMAFSRNCEMLRSQRPSVLVGTPGRVAELVRTGALRLDRLSQIVVDIAPSSVVDGRRCTSCEEDSEAREEARRILAAVPVPGRKRLLASVSQPCSSSSSIGPPASSSSTAVLMRQVRRRLSAPAPPSPSPPSPPPPYPQTQTPPQTMTPAASTASPSEELTELTLSKRVAQLYLWVEEDCKAERLTGLLDAVEFRQAVVFVGSTARAVALDKLLTRGGFPSIAVHAELREEDRNARVGRFQNFEKRLLISDGQCDWIIDAGRVDLVLNYDAPADIVEYLRRTGRAAGAAMRRESREGGSSGGKEALGNIRMVTFAASLEDEAILRKAERQFGASIGPMHGQVPPLLMASAASRHVEELDAVMVATTA